MSSLTLTLRHSLIAVAVATLAACGGGGGGGEDRVTAAAAQDFVSRIAAADAVADAAGGRRSALAANQVVEVSIDAKAALDWAEYKFPSLFSQRIALIPSIDYDGKTFYARIYSGAGGAPRYLGVTTDGRIFGLGDFTGNALQQFETLSYWAVQVSADTCSVYPGSCTVAEPTVPINSCALSSQTQLAIGSRLTATYIQSGSANGQFTIESLVEAADTFEGKSAVRTSSKFSLTLSSGGATISSTNTTLSYSQAAANGYTRELGDTSNYVNGAIVFNGQPIGGQSGSTRTVFNPPDINSEFSLQPGQSLTRTTTSTTSGTGFPSAVTASSTTTYTYEANETITVRGKTYNTCRYREVDVPSSGTVTTTWHIIGKGLPAKTVSVTTVTGMPTETTTSELDTATINGAPL